MRRGDCSHLRRQLEAAGASLMIHTIRRVGYILGETKADQVAAASAHSRACALFFAASCLAVGGLMYSASLTAGSLADRELDLQAEDLARYISPDENQKPRLELPPPLKQAYSAAAQQSLFAIRDKDGHIVEASTVQPRPAASEAEPLLTRQSDPNVSIEARGTISHSRVRFKRFAASSEG